LISYVDPSSRASSRRTHSKIVAIRNAGVTSDRTNCNKTSSR